jgi:hypothetical protein
MESVLSYITVLPSTGSELENFKKLLKVEMLNTSYSYRYQLVLLQSMIDSLLNDEQLEEHWNEI